MWFSFRRKLQILFGVVALTSSASVLHANNVQVALEGSLLKVFGDQVANSVKISQSVTEVVVSGQFGTLVNGQVSISFPGIALNALEIRMEGGHDSVTLEDLQIANDLFVSLGDGDDQLFTVGSNTVGANVSIEAGAGTDTVALASMIVFEDLFIDGGLGVSNVDLMDMEARKGMTIVSDENADTVRIIDSWISEALSIETKGGNDIVTVANGMSFSLEINADLGADRVGVSDWISVEDIGIFTGAGNDSVSLVSVTSGKSLTVSVDAGNDSVSGTTVSVFEDAIFEGGAGVDTLTDRGITGRIKKEIKEFERLLN